MSLNLEFFNRATNITAKVIADSISEAGHRITTFEIEYPRFIHGELMTHRMLSKNSSSSRAIPVNKMLNQIEDNMATPVYWGKNKSGMQAVEEVQGLEKDMSQLEWKNAYYKAKESVEWMVETPNLHKQVPNRLSEPFQMMKVVITGTDWGNFFNLRIHPDAQPEICMLAYKMYKAMEDSEPQLLKGEQWHLPYVNSAKSDALDSMGNRYEDLEYYVGDFNFLSLEEAIKISAASCASVSYRTEGMTLEKADKIFDMLINAEVIHASPFEHLATPIDYDDVDTTDYTNPHLSSRVLNALSTVTGITHINSNGDLCSGNLRGWISYRHQLPNNTNWKFDFENRMEIFK